MQKKNVWKFITKKRERLKCVHQIKKEGNEQFGRKMIQGVGGNRKLFWK